MHMHSFTKSPPRFEPSLSQGDFLFLVKQHHVSPFLHTYLLNPNKNVSVLVCKWQFADLLNSYGTCLILYVAQLMFRFIFCSEKNIFYSAFIFQLFCSEKNILHA